MGFNIILTDGGRRTRDRIFDYYLNELQDSYIAQKVYKDYLMTLDALAKTADAHPIYEDIGITGENLRRIRFNHYKYKIFYEIRGDKVYIKAILHDKQLPRKWLEP